MIPHSFSFYYNYTTLKRHANDYLYYVCLIYLRVFNTYPIENVLILLLRTPNTRNQESLDKVYHFCLISLFFFFTCFFFFFYVNCIVGYWSNTSIFFYIFFLFLCQLQFGHQTICSIMLNYIFICVYDGREKITAEIRADTLLC